VAWPVIAITLITSSISYAAFTSLVQGSGAFVSGSISERFVAGFKVAALALGIISSIAVLPSFLGGRVLGQDNIKTEPLGT
jgi:hypothetical protein